MDNDTLHMLLRLLTDLHAASGKEEHLTRYDARNTVLTGLLAMQEGDALKASLPTMRAALDGATDLLMVLRNAVEVSEILTGKPERWTRPETGQLAYQRVIRHPGEGYVESRREDADTFSLEVNTLDGSLLRFSAEVDRGGWVDRADGDREFADAEATSLRILDALSAQRPE